MRYVSDLSFSLDKQLRGESAKVTLTRMIQIPVTVTHTRVVTTTTASISTLRVTTTLTVGQSIETKAAAAQGPKLGGGNTNPVEKPASS